MKKLYLLCRRILSKKGKVPPQNALVHRCTDKLHWMKDNSPVYIDYIVDGYHYVRVHCQNYPGFHCEQSK